MGNLEFTILSVATATFRGNDGQERAMYKIYMADSTGSVGCVYSSHAYQTGDIVQLEPYVKNDGKFAVRIAR